MKTVSKILLMITLTALMLAMAMPAMAAGKAPAGTATRAKAMAPAPAPPEEHPQIRAALAALRDSKAHLEHAAHDFGGHRVDAIKSIDEAIRQLEICLQYDKH